MLRRTDQLARPCLSDWSRKRPTRSSKRTQVQRIGACFESNGSAGNDFWRLVVLKETRPAPAKGDSTFQHLRPVIQPVLALTRVLMLVSAVATLASCAPVRASLELQTTPPLCMTGDEVSWISLDNDTRRSALDNWCRVVGTPLVAPLPV